jgi:AraC-like DNA-binding protein
MQAFNEILPVSSSPVSNAMSEIITYIKNNIGESFTLDTLAGRVNLSKFYFSHLFKEETGLSPMEFISKTRINLAKIILKTTRGTISEIAINLGYSSSASFINAFTARTGISPGKFRHTGEQADTAASL